MRSLPATSKPEGCFPKTRARWGIIECQAGASLLYLHIERNFRTAASGKPDDRSRGSAPGRRAFADHPCGRWITSRSPTSRVMPVPAPRIERFAQLRGIGALMFIGCDLHEVERHFGYGNSRATTRSTA